jgi:hypothetical protein
MAGILQPKLRNDLAVGPYKQLEFAGEGYEHCASGIEEGITLPPLCRPRNRPIKMASASPSPGIVS